MESEERNNYSRRSSSADISFHSEMGLVAVHSRASPNMFESIDRDKKKYCKENMIEKGKESYNGIVASSRPVYFSLRLFGLMFGDPLATSDEKKPNIWMSYLGFFYCIIVFFILLGNFIHSVYIFNKIHSDFYIFGAGYSVFCLRALLMSGCCFLASKHCTTRGKISKLSRLYMSIYKFIVNLPKHEDMNNETYSRRAKVSLTVTVGFALINIVFYITMSAAGRADSIISVVCPVSFTDVPRSIQLITTSVVIVFMVMTWILPMTLFISICDSLFYLMDKFYNTLRCPKTDLVDPTWKHPRNLRHNYLELIKVVAKADSDLSVLALLMFVSDIIISCIDFYVALDAKLPDFVKYSSLSMAIIAMFMMIAISYEASRIADKGKEMADVVQSMSLYCPDFQSASEVNLLLAIIADQPIVMTIGKFIPLYKSVIVSVLVTIITYFTLILQLRPTES